MSLLDKLWERIAGRQRSLPAGVPLVKEPLQRSEYEKQAYFRWLQGKNRLPLCEEVHKAYQCKCAMVPHAFAVHVLQMPYANGFALTYHVNIGEPAFQHLFDWLKDRVLGLDYSLSFADRRLFDRAAYVESIERYYLKPGRQDLEMDLIDQQYGNVLLECVWIDNKPSYLKLVANIYADRMYTEAKPFAALMREVFSVC